MAKTIKLWVARDNQKLKETWLFVARPTKAGKVFIANFGSGGVRLLQHLGLKPGQLKRAKLVIDG